MRTHLLLNDIHDVALVWVNNELQARNMAPVAQLTLVREMAWSLVAKVEHEQGVWYLKCLPDYFAHELATTQYLSQRFPQRVARFIAMDPSRNFLLVDDAGPMLRERYEEKLDASMWFEALTGYADMQIQLMGNGAVQQMGIPNRSLRRLPELIGDDLEALILMNGDDEEDQLRPDDCAFIHNAFREWEKWIAPLYQHDITDTINHGDFHDGNFAYTDRPVIFDWGDISLTHPFMSLRSSFVSIERRFGYHEHSSEMTPFLEAYLTPWQRFAPMTELKTMFRQGQRIWALVSYLSWQWAIRNKQDERATRYNYALPGLLREFSDAAQRP